LGPLTYWLSRPLFAVYAACIATYLAIVAVVSLSIALRMKKPTSTAWLAIVFPVVHFSSGFGSLAELISGKSLDDRFHEFDAQHETSAGAAGQ
jgi:hypothetical protein